MYRTILLTAFIALWQMTPPVHAARTDTLLAALPPTGVDVALVLAVDVSSSVDDKERRFQRMAYARALSDPLVIRAALGGRSGRIALGYMEWSGPSYQHHVLPIRVISTADGLQEFSNQIAVLAEQGHAMEGDAYSYFSGTTAMGNALISAANAIRGLDVQAQSVVIDLSADGINNDGVLLDKVRDELVAEGFTINGLPIAVGRTATNVGNSKAQANAKLESFFEHCVIGGRGAFQIMAHGWEDVEQALRAKLILELAGFDPVRRQLLARAMRGQGYTAEQIMPAQFTLQLGPEAAPARRKFNCSSGRFRPPIPAQQP